MSRCPRSIGAIASLAMSMVITLGVTSSTATFLDNPKECGVAVSKVWVKMYTAASFCAQDATKISLSSNSFQSCLDYKPLKKCAAALKRLSLYSPGLAPNGCEQPALDIIGTSDAQRQATCQDIAVQALVRYGEQTGIYPAVTPTPTPTPTLTPTPTPTETPTETPSPTPTETP